MGTRGPVPKRSTERRRRNTPVAGEVIKIPAPTAPVVSAPDTPAKLHPIAEAWFDSLKVSGQAKFYEPSDWATAIYVAREMSRQLKARFSAQGFVAILSAMTELLTTEGARRRASIEIQRAGQDDDEQDAEVTALDDYRDALGG